VFTDCGPAELAQLPAAYCSYRPCPTPVDSAPISEMHVTYIVTSSCRATPQNAATQACVVPQGLQLAAPGPRGGPQGVRLNAQPHQPGKRFEALNSAAPHWILHSITHTRGFSAADCGGCALLGPQFNAALEPGLEPAMELSLRGSEPLAPLVIYGSEVVGLW